jgi:hypothetical protein
MENLARFLAARGQSESLSLADSRENLKIVGDAVQYAVANKYRIHDVVAVDARCIVCLFLPAIAQTSR